MSPHDEKIQEHLLRLEEDFAQTFNWWWRVPEWPHNDKPYPIDLVMRCSFRKDFQESFWYELEARMKGYDLARKPKYRLEAPFNQLSRLPMRTEYPHVPKPYPMIVERLEHNPKQIVRVGMDLFYMAINVRDFPDGTLIAAFKHELQIIRAYKKIPAPPCKTHRQHRISSKGRSFRPIEAMDVMTFSEDETLKIKYRRDYSRAKRAMEELRRFTPSRKKPGILPAHI
jgi:hypothetical protein